MRGIVKGAGRIAVMAALATIVGVSAAQAGQYRRSTGWNMGHRIGPVPRGYGMIQIPNDRAPTFVPPPSNPPLWPQNDPHKPSQNPMPPSLSAPAVPIRVPYNPKAIGL